MQGRRNEGRDCESVSADLLSAFLDETTLSSTERVSPFWFGSSDFKVTVESGKVYPGEIIFADGVVSRRLPCPFPLSDST